MVMKHAADAVALCGRAMTSQGASSVPLRALKSNAGEWNQRYQMARNFQVYHMNRFCGNLVRRPEKPKWSKFLFFLDLDGVFDRELLGFPHTTWKGLASLALLQSCGFSVVVNTGRSVEHVRNYCQSYALPGGLAEYGSVFVDAVGHRELPLTDREGAEQLARCRETIRKLPGAFIDPGYGYSVRAYRFSGRSTTGLSHDEVQDLIESRRFDRLTCVHRDSDTYIVQKGTGKSPGLLAVKEYLGGSFERVAAIGDSVEDLEMLQAAEFAYAPGNCSKEIRRSVKNSRCRIITQSFQSGLWAAVGELLHNGAKTGSQPRSDAIPARDQSMDLMQMLLRVADRRPLSQFVSLLNWREL